VWLLFHFDDNGALHSPRSKVQPPRLRGESKGVFSTRAPHRPNPLGLTLARLDGVEGATLHLSALDLVDGTPILDVKPYIPAYDAPPPDQVRCPAWSLPNAAALLDVRVSEEAQRDLGGIEQAGVPPRLSRDWSEALQGLSEVLAQDPRSTYRKQKCADEEYPIYFDRLKAWCIFDSEEAGGAGVEIIALSVEDPPKSKRARE